LRTELLRMTTDGERLASERAAAHRDLAAAAHLQRLLLPPSPLTAPGWTAVHHFEPAGAVSGDYVDLVPFEDRLYFMLGDVSGKGIPAALLMAQLHAMFRTLIPFGMPLDALMARASALLCASSLPAQYATLVSGYLDPEGEVVLCNAGHPPPLVIRGQARATVDATGVPMGLFCESQFTSTRQAFSPGDSLLIYTDGLTEARNAAGEEYGASRVEHVAAAVAQRPLQDLVTSTLRAHADFRGDVPTGDDLTVLAIRRS
jgi:sigma-B regulation protein RsbU (phosphoserine phosphatase)